jgi:DNA-binding IclR family transcriptional regulator
MRKKAEKVLAYLLARPRWHSADAIMRGTQLPKATVYRELSQLRGFEQTVQRKGTRGAYFFRVARPHACVCDCRELRQLRRLKREVVALLDALGRDAIRVRKGGGPEDLALSISTTFGKLHQHFPVRGL